MADAELRTLLRRLTLPIYLPAALYASGAFAIVPVLPLVGLRLGLTVPQVALLVAVAGVRSLPIRTRTRGLIPEPKYLSPTVQPLDKLGDRPVVG